MTKMGNKVQALLNGVSEVLPAGSSILQNGQTVSQKSMVSTLQGYLSLFTAADEGKQQYATAQAALKAQATAIQQYVTLLDQALRTFLGPNAPQLVQFGLTPRGAPKSPSPETKAIANVQRQLTRKARGIIGKAQRSQITATPKASLVVLGPDGQPLSGGGQASSTPAAGSPATGAPAK